MDIKIVDIQISKRYRKDIGDLSDLKESIKVLGLLHPIVITPDKRLIAGQRRLLACKELGWNEIPATIVDLEDVFRGQLDENVVRKDFLPTEMVAIGEEIEKRERQAAKKRQQEAGKTRGKGKEIAVGKFPDAIGHVRDKVAAYFDVSGKTYEKMKTVVQEGGTQLAADMDKTRNIDRAYKKTKAEKTKKKRQEIADAGGKIKQEDKWIVEIGDIKMYSTSKKFDYIITDPPYPKEYLDLWDVLAKRSNEWLEDGGMLIAMSGHLYLDEIYKKLSEYMEYYWTGCYLTPGQSTPLRTRKVNTFWKPLLFFCKKNDKYTGKGFGDVFKSVSPEKELHDWGQSVSGMYDIISKVCLPGQSIFDPFCGAGSTGVAAIKHGCLFYGLDIEETNVNISRKRIYDELHHNSI